MQHSTQAIHAKAIELGKLAVQMTTQSGAGHPSSALSLSHLVTTLFFEHLRFDPDNPWHPQADRLVLSEGHAVPIVYAVYADMQGRVGTSPSNSHRLSITDLNGLREFESVLDGHPNPAEGFPFFDAATGSLGMGLSVAAGVAWAALQDGSPRRVYCFIGDGESREGQIWEAADFTIDHKLTNLCAIFNANGEGQAGLVSPQQHAARLIEKLQAFGWRAVEIDGHDPQAIHAAFVEFEQTDRPLAIVARTRKGWGVQPLLGGNYHGQPVPAARLAEAFVSLDEQHRQLGSSPALAVELRSPISIPPRSTTASASPAIQLPPITAALERVGLSGAWQKGKLATRRAYGAALVALADMDERIVVLDGDVSNSTFAEMMAKAHPRRFIECKIAEQNMVSVAAGLAAAGKIPFASSFAKFLARAADQIELAAISRANIKLVGSHSGLGPASDGPSQMALADLAFFQSIGAVDNGRHLPSCVIFQPADAVATYRCVELMANWPAMCYLRTHRPDARIIYSVDERFEVGGSKILRQGNAVILVASGYLVGETMGAAESLAQRGCSCTVIDAYSLPLQSAPILESARNCGGRILTVEDNYGGGFGTAIAEAAAAAGSITVRQIQVRRIPKSARTPEQLMNAYGVSAAAIVEQVIAWSNEV
ncbi:MAG: Transketolase 2 [Phycisphaerae bacterium]|nr:Transketolase 2 [Phycisphaerae bacterium]